MQLPSKFLCALILLACVIGHASAQDNCPYLPAFTSLQKKLNALTPLKAVMALQTYAATHDNPENCELIELDRLLASREIGMVTLLLHGKQIPAQIVYRCNEFNPITAQCQSPMEDGTAHPTMMGLPIMPRPKFGSPFSIFSTLPTTKLVGFYQISLADALDGKPAQRLPSGSGKLPTMRKSSALIAIYKTQGPWAYRKAVWYFE